MEWWYVPVALGAITIFYLLFFRSSGQKKSTDKLLTTQKEILAAQIERDKAQDAAAEQQLKFLTTILSQLDEDVSKIKKRVDKLEED